MDKKQIRAAKIKRQQELLDAAKKAGNRSLTDTEQAEFDSLQREIDTLTEEIRAAENPQTPAAPAPAQTPTPAATANASRSADPAPGPEDNIQRAIAAERTRVNEITAMCRDFGVSELDYIQNGSTVEQVRAAIMDGLRKNGAPIRTGIKVPGSGQDEFRRDAADGLLIRGGLNPEKASDGAQQMANMTLRDMAIECLERSGVADARRKSSDDLFTMLMQRQFYNPTAAFPAILDNAIKYSAPGGRITVKLWAGEYKAFVEILDQGRGIPPEDLENVKTKFYKGSNSVRGSGIGLALVDSIMTALDGTMDIQSTLGRGTVVTLGLPLYHKA